jgi:hypothetical protein
MGSGIRIFPNPASQSLNISSPWPMAELRLVNLQGMELLRMKTAGELTTMDVSGLDAGVYILQLMMDERMITRKVMIR